MINIILCGGNGTRLWPLSRSKSPKQFSKFMDQQSLFQKTVQRNQNICNQLMIVSNEEQYFMALDQLHQIDVEDSLFLLEPVGRNTAPAIALACLHLNKDDIVLVTPSDHFVKNVTKYEALMEEAQMFARDGYLVTFGIKPTYPETGFGYIESSGNDVISFKEKPDADTAMSYMERGNFYWNSGMFIFKAGVFLEQLLQYSPDIFMNSKNAYDNASKNNFIRIKIEDMMAIPAISIDYSLMEKSDRVKVIHADIDWSDLGNFEALHRELPRNEYGNTISDNSVNIDSKNNLILTSDRLVTTIDVEDLIIIDTSDALLVSKQGSSQKVKEIVGKLQLIRPELTVTHSTVYKTWGHYTVLEVSQRYKIKRVVVKAGQKLALQKHFHRNEHWIVVNGTAQVTIDGDVKIIRTNESTYIPMGVEHRLENPGKIDLILIEVQSGDYLDEDDTLSL